MLLVYFCCEGGFTKDVGQKLPPRKSMECYLFYTLMKHYAMRSIFFFPNMLLRRFSLSFVSNKAMKHYAAK